MAPPTSSLAHLLPKGEGTESLSFPLPWGEGVGHEPTGEGLLWLRLCRSALPGQNLQALVNLNPPSTTLSLAAGVDRLQSVVPKSNDSFVGQTGAILSGAGILISDSYSISIVQNNVSYCMNGIVGILASRDNGVIMWPTASQPWEPFNGKALEPRQWRQKISHVVASLPPLPGLGWRHGPYPTASAVGHILSALRAY